MSQDDNIPELTDIATDTAQRNQNEFDFDGLIPGKALTADDIKNLEKEIDRIIKQRITIHNKLLYKDLSKNINLLIKNIRNDS